MAPGKVTSTTRGKQQIQSSVGHDPFLLQTQLMSHTHTHTHTHPHTHRHTHTGPFLLQTQLTSHIHTHTLTETHNMQPEETECTFTSTNFCGKLIYQGCVCACVCVCIDRKSTRLNSS